MTKIALKVPLAGRNCSLVLATSKCGEGISLGHEPANLLGLRQNNLYTRTLEAWLVIQQGTSVWVGSPSSSVGSQISPFVAEIDFPIGLAMVVTLWS
jgi:hypothetical protein